MDGLLKKYPELAIELIELEIAWEFSEFEERFFKLFEE